MLSRLGALLQEAVGATTPGPCWGAGRPSRHPGTWEVQALPVQVPTKARAQH
ncbi:FAM160B2 isoform 10 [Pan troglodytes]|uniref:FHF complex subunit HOOK interacting protein 2B n=2 Tax=Homininae TaxID=207598 RepID=F2Z2X3_HUMAN|nr:hypothetical protein KI723_080256 [Homo sapiens]KAI4009820.1 hypothetical protein G5576_113788 [Homo sapiens]PNI68356.1 FAM160B2 isoform 10 [Pan troglodytes]